jgi:hypothetical protein
MNSSATPATHADSRAAVGAVSAPCLIALARVRDHARTLVTELSSDADLTRTHDRAKGIADDVVRVRDLAFKASCKHARIRINALAKAIVSDLVSDLDLAREVEIDNKRVRDLVPALDRAFASAHEAVLAIGGVRGLAQFRTLDSLLSSIRDDALATDRGRIPDKVQEIPAALNAIAIDVSGADLRRLEDCDPGSLVNVIWTRQTTWPAGIIEQIRAGSREIRPGVYRVTGTGDRAHDPVIGVSADLPTSAICDWCSAAPPIDIWLPGSQYAQMSPTSAARLTDSSSTTPWALCRACSHHVKTENTKRLLQRWRALSPLPPGLTDRAQLLDHEDRVRAFLLPFVTSKPQGPYPLHGPGKTH